MKRATALVLLLFTLSGAAGLLYEIVWIRMLSHLLGGTTYAISTVLAAFMGGLALGSRYYGRRADHTARPLLLYARLELGIALFGVLVYLLIRMAPPAYVAAAGVLPSPLLALLRVLIAAALLLPPTFLMGGTLPVLSRFIVTSRDRVGRGLGVLYAVNTLGAVLGSFLAGFVLIAALGHLGSVALAVALNLLVGGMVWLVDRREGAVEHAPADAPPKPATAGQAPQMGYLALCVVFALSGFASLGYELYWTRALQHFLGNSTYAFSAMLTTFLFGLAVGGWVGGRLADRVQSPARLLGWIQVLVGVFALSTAALIWEWLPRVKESVFMTSRDLPLTVHLLRRFLVAFLVMALPTFLTGMTFPLVNRIWIRSLEALGQGVGGLYFANTIGAILGSLAAGFVVLPLLGAKAALIATAGLSVAVGMACHVARRDRVIVDPLATAAVLIALIVAAPALNRSGQRLLADTQDEQDVVLFDEEDHAGETRVYRKSTGDLHMSVDGHHIGGTEPNIIRKEKILAHLPMVLNPDAKRTLSIGLGSGVTLGTLGMYDEIETLECVEIVPGVIEGASYFNEYNENVLSDPRLRMHVGDGVQFMLTTRERFDIICSDSKLNPEYAGNAPLLARDYYELCRDRLTDNGVMVQWLAVHIPAIEIRQIARGFAQIFPYAAVYWYDPSHMLFAGSKSPITLDMDAARRNVKRDRIAQDAALLNIDDPYVMASLFVCGREQLQEKLGEGSVSTWEHSTIEFTMGRRYLQKPRPYHEDDTLRWLRVLREPSAQQLQGSYDPEVYQRYMESSAATLEGFAMGGGIARLQNAIDVFKSALEKNPDDGRLEDLVVHLDAMSRDIDEAMEGGRMNTPQGLMQAGMLRRDQGRHQEALELFERAYQMSPDDPNIQYNRLLALKTVGRRAEYLDALMKFAREFPRDARSHALRGREHAANGDLEAAVESFRRAIELNPESPHNHNNLATALAGLERYEAAAREFEVVCESDPALMNAAYFAAASFSMAGMTADAARWARFCIERGLAPAEKFATDPLFANLRASEHWDAAASRPR